MPEENNPNIKDIVRESISKIRLGRRHVSEDQILKSRCRHQLAVLCKAYIHAISLFPDNKLGDSSKIASCVASKLFELSTDEDNSAIDENQIEKLYGTVSADEWILKTLSNYFLLEVFYLSYVIPSEDLKEKIFKEKIESAVEKSKKYADSATPITVKNFHSVDKTIKSDLKRFMKEARKLSGTKLKVEQLEYAKSISQFSITSKHVLSLSSIFSSLFLVGGLFYNQIFFNYLGVNVVDFFDISDYLASSVSTLSYVLFTTLVGIFFYVLGIIEARNKEIVEKEFDIKYKERYLIHLHLLLIAIPIGLLLHWYYFGITPLDNRNLLMLTIMMSFIYILKYGMSRFPWSHIKNPLMLVVFFHSMSFFFLLLWSSAKDDIEAITSGEYISPYKVEFTENYEKYSNDKFISANSNYVFMWDDAGKELNVIPKSGIISFSVNQK